MTLNQQISELRTKLKNLTQKLLDLSKNTEEKLNKPYSKVGHNRLLSNRDLVFDGNERIWKTYAVYKDDDEEE